MALNLVCAVLDRGPSDLSEMAVLLAIADSADKDTGEAWPSQATIAQRARQTDRSVRNVIGRLVAAGWLSVEERRRPNGSRRSSLYTVNLAKLGEARAKPAPEPAGKGKGNRNGVPVATGTTFRGVPERGSGHAPEPRSALEPSQKKEPCAAVDDRRAAGRSASPRQAAARPVERSGQVRGVAVAAGAASQVSADLARMTAYERSMLLQGRDTFVAGVGVKAGSPLFEALRQAARGASAEKRGAA